MPSQPRRADSEARGTARRLAPIVLLASLLLLLPAVGAHGLPRPIPEQRTILLQDWSDDCGAPASGACRGSHDLVGLTLQEAYDATLGNVVLLRLYLDKGGSGSHQDTISITTPSGVRTLSLQSPDDRTFTGTGFDRVGSPEPVPGEATRFSIEGAVRLSALGAVGDKLSGFRVEAQAGSTVGDFMPGGCHKAVGDCIAGVDGDADEEIKRSEYVLRGPTYYARLATPANAVEVAQGLEQMADLQIVNLLADQSQRIEVTASAGPGVTARFHDPADPAGSGHSDKASLVLPPRGTSSIHLSLGGVTAGSEGTVRITVTTDLGGRLEEDVPYRVTAGGTCDPAMQGMHGMPACPSGTSGTTTKASPLPAAALAVLALALAGARRRT